MAINDSKRLLRGVGTVKSNVNHTDSTSGLVNAFIKIIQWLISMKSINVQDVKQQLNMFERGMI